MKRVLLIGIGAGDPELVTMQAVGALNEVDVFLVLDKGADTEDLVRIRKEICARFIEPDRSYRFVEARDPERTLASSSYQADVADWHQRRADIVERLLIDELDDGGCAGFLVWGDPALYDSTLRIVEQVRDRGTVEVSVEVIPGISCIQVLAARHRIALNQVGGAVQVTTGRRLRAGLPDGVGDVVVMLDGQCSFTALDPDGIDIYWGAYLGTPDEILVAGPLAQVSEEIVERRRQARERKGWMFDTYLLRRHL